MRRAAADHQHAHWGGIIPEWQLKALVAYLKTLK